MKNIILASSLLLLFSCQKHEVKVCECTHVIYKNVGTTEPDWNPYWDDSTVTFTDFCANNGTFVIENFIYKRVTVCE
jgi:hypothetical protein